MRTNPLPTRRRAFIGLTSLVTAAALFSACVAGPGGAPDTTTTTTTTTTIPAEIAITSSDPASPATSISPRLIGFAPAGTNVVRIFPSSDCTGVAWAGDLATFSGIGIMVNVGLGTTTTFTAIASGAVVSSCSAPFTFVNSLAPPT